MKRAIVIQDVAARAGVSVTTVSRVLTNSSHPVNAETARRVIEAAEALGFTPSPIARAMVTQHSGIVGALVGDNTDPYFATIVHGIHAAAQQFGAITIIGNTLRNPGTELDYVRLLDSYKADGIILAGGELTGDVDCRAQMHAAIERYLAAGGRVIALSETSLDVPRIVVDNRQASYDAARYLISLGHRRIGYVRGPVGLLTTQVREEGFQAALADSGIDAPQEYRVDGEFTFLGGLDGIKRLLALPEPPTAVLATNDIMALGCFVGANQAGLAIPGDLSLVGMDDIQAALYAHPQLTTVHFPMNEMGAEAVRQIYQAEDEGPAPRVRVLPHALVLRGTASPVQPAAA